MSLKIAGNNIGVVVKGGEGMSPKSISGSTLNSYVSGYLTEAFSNYPNDASRTSTSVPSYAIALQGVRKDEPVPLTVSLESGELSIRENSNYATKKSTIVSGQQNIYNISKDGGDFILEDNGSIIDVGTLNVSNFLRMIYAPSVHNVRDLGGWDTYNSNGIKEGTIKYGKLYRGGEIDDNISASDKALFNDVLKIGSEIDFYLSHTGEDKSILGDNVIYNSCYTAYSYKNLIDLDNSTNLNVIKKAINSTFYAVENNLPLYFHCQVGADRTGTLAFILGAMLGMDEVELDIDWELTSFSATLPSSYLIAGWRTRNDPASHGASYREMINYFKSCTTNPTSIRDAVIAWAVLAGIDIADINTFRQNMIDGTPETVTASINYNATSITLSTSTVEIGTGESATLTATVLPSWATSSVTWSSSATSVATISASGKTCVVTGVTVGNATITATCNGLTATCGVTITQDQEEPQYTGNIVTQVGYNDNKRWRSGGTLADSAGMTAINKFNYVYQNDGKFQLHLSGINWSASDICYLVLLDANETALTYATLHNSTSNRNYGWYTVRNQDGTMDILFTRNTGSSTFVTSSKIALCGRGAGANASIEQVFPATLDFPTN